MRKAWVGVALLGALLSTAASGKDQVAARVNGVPIYRSAVERGIPKNTFAARAKNLREVRLQRLIDQSLQAQFLKSKGVKVTERELDRKVAQLRKEPPNTDCPCHRFPSLGKYLEANSLTLAEMREELRNEIGMERYLARLWHARYPDAARRRALAAQARPDLESRYARVWHLFFDTWLQRSKPDQAGIDARAHSRAEAAWKRLQKGEPFDRLARAISEDRISGPSGGYVGLILKGTYGREFVEALDRLKPGETSRPFRTIFGYHIARWAPLSDAQLLEIHRKDFADRMLDEVMQQVESTYRVERL